MTIIENSRTAFRLLNGIICVYKPAGLQPNFVRATIIKNLCNDLCQLEVRSPGKHVFIEGDPHQSLTVNVGLNYADHPSVVGPRFQEKDIICKWATNLGNNTSGIFVLGLNEGIYATKRLHKTHPIRIYHVQGILGQATSTYFTDGKVMEKATFKHVKKDTVDRVLSAIQASYQRIMFEESGLDIQSQAAYELAVQGPIRPADDKLVLMYGLRCIKFEPPNFTIEVSCINENEDFLTSLVHEIGIRVNSAATCTSMRCIRHSLFTLKDALLRKHWRLEHVLNNVTVCEKIVNQSKHFKQTVPKLTAEPNVLNDQNTCVK